jgi:hypothetical protein
MLPVDIIKNWAVCHYSPAPAEIAAKMRRNILEIRMPSYLPAQAIAKLYTEGLGRAPDQNGWKAIEQYFQAGGCGAPQIKAVAIGVLDSPEANALPYSPEDRVLTYYRSILNRDPDAGGLAYWVAQMRLKPAKEVIGAIASSSEAVNYQLRSCVGGSQGFGSGAVAATMTGAQLQAAIDNLPAGGTLTLPQRTVVSADRSIVLHRGRTLTTEGSPGPNAYAIQARIVRSANFTGPLIALKPGAVLQALWIDGGRSRWTYIPGNYNVRAEGGFGTSVLSSKLSDTAGATSIEFRNAPDVLEAESDRRAIGNRAIDNLITSYSSSQLTRTWSDGISVHAEGTELRNNAVIDATDVAIILFSYPSPWLGGSIVPQASQAIGNTIINTGNNAFAALAVDPFFTYARVNNSPAVGDAIGVSSRSFVGTRIENNLFWTGGSGTYEIGMAIGTRPWFGINSYTGRGGVYNGNTTGVLSANVDFGIVVSGMIDVEVQNNRLLLNASDFSLCPYTSETQASRADRRSRSGNVGLGLGFASGSIQDGGGYVIAPFTGCIGKRLP